MPGAMASWCSTKRSSALGRVALVRARVRAPEADRLSMPDADASPSPFRGSPDLLGRSRLPRGAARTRRRRPRSTSATAVATRWPLRRHRPGSARPHQCHRRSGTGADRCAAPAAAASARRQRQPRDTRRGAGRRAPRRRAGRAGPGLHRTADTHRSQRTTLGHGGAAARPDSAAGPRAGRGHGSARSRGLGSRRLPDACSCSTGPNRGCASSQAHPACTLGPSSWPASSSPATSRPSRARAAARVPAVPARRAAALLRPRWLGPRDCSVGRDPASPVPIELVDRSDGVRTAVIAETDLLAQRRLRAGRAPQLPMEQVRERFLQRELGLVDGIKELVNLQPPGIALRSLPRGAAGICRTSPASYVFRARSGPGRT